jgi:prepilin-type N-terminal cleavage/methylation domain-containing protein
MGLRVAQRQDKGFTLVEIMTSVMLLATFFGAVFELNTVCLRYVNASKENVAAIQGVQDRVETLRNLAFTDLTSASYMTTLLTTPSNSAPLAQRVVETVTMSDYPNGTPAVTYSRAAGANVTPTANWTGGTGFGSTTNMLKVNVRYNWTTTFSGRARSEETESLIAGGIKK